jgi:hypothetical protein
MSVFAIKPNTDNELTVSSVAKMDQQPMHFELHLFVKP